jgi:hypothetical protein
MKIRPDESNQEFNWSLFISSLIKSPDLFIFYVFNFLTIDNQFSTKGFQKINLHQQLHLSF